MESGILIILISLTCTHINNFFLVSNLQVPKNGPFTQLAVVTDFVDGEGETRFAGRVHAEGEED